MTNRSEISVFDSIVCKRCFEGQLFTCLGGGAAKVQLETTTLGQQCRLSLRFSRLRQESLGGGAANTLEPPTFGRRGHQNAVWKKRFLGGGAASTFEPPVFGRRGNQNEAWYDNAWAAWPPMRLSLRRQQLGGNAANAFEPATFGRRGRQNAV